MLCYFECHQKIILCLSVAAAAAFVVADAAAADVAYLFDPAVSVAPAVAAFVAAGVEDLFGLAAFAVPADDYCLVVYYPGGGHCLFHLCHYVVGHVFFYRYAPMF